MIEGLWVALLALAASHRTTRALSLLLALKWAANYAGFSLIAQTAPALIDVALGTVGVIWASRRRAAWSDVVIAGFVLTPLVHAWYWFQHAGGAVSAPVYYWLIVGLFTGQVGAVAWPAAHKHTRTVLRRLGWIRTEPSSPQ